MVTAEDIDTPRSIWFTEDDRKISSEICDGIQSLRCSAFGFSANYALRGLDKTRQSTNRTRVDPAISNIYVVCYLGAFNVLEATINPVMELPFLEIAAASNVIS